MSSDEVGCSFVVFPVGYKRSVEVVDNFCVIILVCLGQSLATMSVLSLRTLSFISMLMCDWGMGRAMVVVRILPIFGVI